ncbi:enoyl-CoA hydratase/isomerase family protein [Aquincola sp. S2]|uniref:Enoyl-CoA hydratase/isomerase family protein n=1 Tax=Pseudaquabacterium terrae TaxID=2732868 RepID=A0ABX2EI30_9BURK|nr:enoyl-CoA hydratase-related protein [Aquabacterium terrae]NRF68282.1 enoyl-CoA hydratase/isomerase family protein [Aquabacterium terrae]
MSALFETLLVARDAPLAHGHVSSHARGVWLVTLNRPDCRNAMSLQMVQELRAVLADAEASGDARVIVLRGAGGHFCSGGDIKDMAAARMRPLDANAANRDPLAAVNAAFGELCVAYAGTGLALVVIAEGTVMGGGFGLACVADVVLASPTAQFRLPETSLGVVPAQVASFLVERLGYSEARRLAVTGARLGAHAALTLRLVHEVHGPAELEIALARTLDEILQCAPGALAATKRLIAKARFERPASLVAEAAAVFSNALQSPEGQEGTRAFIQKRKPSWAPK